MGFEPQNDNTKPLNLYPDLNHKDHDEPTKSVLPLETLQETKHDDSHQVQSKPSDSHIEPDSSPKHHDDDPISGLHPEPKNISRSGSSNSSSSLSSSESFKKESGTNTQSSSRNESVSSADISADISADTCPPTPQWSMISNTPRAGSGHLSYDLLPPNHPDNWNSMFNSSSAMMKSPRMQTMSRPAGYDPNRIPSHVFSTKANATMEWSVASNESLFSIHMGNSSFSRDHILQFGDSTTTKPDDLCNEVKSNECTNNGFSSNLAPVFETVSSENDKKFTHDEEDSGIEEHKKLKEIKTKTDQENHSTTEKQQDVQSGKNRNGLSNSSNNLLEGKGSPEANGSGTPNNAPRASNESATSTGSFAFPLLVEVGKNASLKAIDEEKRDEIQPQNHQNHKPTTPKAAAEGGGGGGGGGGGLFSFFTNFPRCC